MTRTAIAVLAALILAPASAAAADNLAGQASVIDGDTLEIHGTRIRLWGVDAPESSQLCRGDDSLQYRCGAKAANDLDAFIAGRPARPAGQQGLCLPALQQGKRQPIIAAMVAPALDCRRSARRLRPRAHRFAGADRSESVTGNGWPLTQDG